MHINPKHHYRPAMGLMSPSCLSIRVQVNNPKFIAIQGPLLCMVIILMIVSNACGLTVNKSAMPEWGHTTFSLK